MKKCLLFLLSLLFVLPLAACARTESTELSLVTTNFAAYDFAREIVGKDNTRVSIELLAAGDVHSFDPTFRDMAKIESADLFLYVGGNSDAAVDALLTNYQALKTFRLVDCVELLTEDHTHDGEPAHDEHVWTSPKNAMSIVSKLCDALVEIDSEDAERYRQNTERYLQKLTVLDEQFSTLFKEQTKPIIVADRFPLLYFAKDYGMLYEAAFPSCHTTSEPSPGKVAELIALAKEHKISIIFHIEGGSHAVADRIAADIGSKTALFHSCHKVTASELADGATYLSLMEQNYLSLKEALTLFS